MATKRELQNKTTDLRGEYEELVQELGTNEQGAQEAMRKRIRLIHEYNDLKETASVLLGLNRMSLGQVYKQFEVSEDDLRQ
ncbi:hypothetical protein VTP01DRAFT_6223 [Rhizomucor pusillus]|uniref:uncharacterized protein n=1 Tax=Rhizomucor pusillus TaxID=4840 RepID=UPI00374215F8